jgi:hypothetical protein
MAFVLLSLLMDHEGHVLVSLAPPEPVNGMQRSNAVARFMLPGPAFKKSCMPSSASRELSVLFSVFLVLLLCLGSDRVDLRFLFYHCRCSLVDSDPKEAPFTRRIHSLCLRDRYHNSIHSSALELLLSLVYDINNSSTLLLDLLSVQRNFVLNYFFLSPSSVCRSNATTHST